MRELNPMELAWAQIERQIRQQNISSVTLERLQSLTQHAIESITPTEWNNLCHHAEEIERQYWDTDASMQLATQDLAVDLEDTDETRDKDDSSSSDDL